MQSDSPFENIEEQLLVLEITALIIKVTGLKNDRIV
jgi:hypothetical protein